MSLNALLFKKEVGLSECLKNFLIEGFNFLLGKHYYTEIQIHWRNRHEKIKRL